MFTNRTMNNNNTNLKKPTNQRGDKKSPLRHRTLRVFPFFVHVKTTCTRTMYNVRVCVCVPYKSPVSKLDCCYTRTTMR